MKLYIDTLKNPYIIIIIILIIIVVTLISYLDDKANKNNKKSFLGHCKLIMICLLSALIMLFGYLFIENSSFTLNIQKSNNIGDMIFSEKILNGTPDF